MPLVMRRPRAGKISPPFRSLLTAWYRYKQGLTNVSGKCSAWADASNGGNSLTQATAANRPTILSDGSLLFDGLASYMQQSLTVNQPCFIGIAFTPLAWTSGAVIVDGSTADFKVTQTGSTPAVVANAGSNLASDSTVQLNTRGVISLYGNGANSVFTACGGAASVLTSGNAGTNNPGGITIGAARAANNFSNIAVREIVIYSGTLDTQTRLVIHRYLARIGNVGGV